MTEDISKKIMDILSNPEMMQKLSDVLGNSGTSEDKSPEQKDTSSALAVNAQNIVSSLNYSDDRRITLLTALKPYLRESRASGVETAIKILKMTKLTEAFKNIDI